MTTKLLLTYKQKIEALKLEPSSGGCFELTIDGKVVYSKLQTGNFPVEDDLLDELKQRFT